MIFLVFLFFLISSFVGSIQPGPVNLGVAYFTLQREKTKALLLALGGSIPEVIYVCFAAKLVSLTDSQQQHIRLVSLVAAMVLVCLGIYLWRYKKSAKAAQQKPPTSSFWSGLILGLLNPQLLLFWSGMIWYIKTAFQLNAFNTNVHLTAAAIGAGLGAFLLHLCYIGLIQKYQHHSLIKALQNAPEKWIGALLFLLGLFGILHSSFYSYT